MRRLFHSGACEFIFVCVMASRPLPLTLARLARSTDLSLWVLGMPIHYAADSGHTAVVEYLISKGADIDVSSHRWRRSSSQLHFCNVAACTLLSVNTTPYF